MKKSKRVCDFYAPSLELRLSGYSALGAVAALGAASSAAGQTIFTTIATPSVTVPSVANTGPGPTGPFTVGPVHMYLSAFFVTVPADSNATARAVAVSPVLVGGSPSHASLATHSFFPLNLAHGAPIAGRNFANTEGYAFLFDQFNTVKRGNFIPSGANGHASGYVGFKFVGSTDSDVKGYGWLHINVAADSAGLPLSIALTPGPNTGSITGAYEALADGTLHAGDIGAIPEPASLATGLALFALGAVGVREHRRRRQLAAS
jgi:hypothetical protein